MITEHDDIHESIFFFQAEDGIRDADVTGVQTCALPIYCDGRVETDFEPAVDLMMRIAEVMAGQPMPDAVRPMVAEGARREDRVMLRLTPYATFESPPRHVHE